MLSLSKFFSNSGQSEVFKEGPAADGAIAKSCACCCAAIVESASAAFLFVFFFFFFFLVDALLFIFFFLGVGVSIAASNCVLTVASSGHKKSASSNFYFLNKQIATS